MTYEKKMLQPGWAGILTLEKAKYIKAALEANPVLRRKWGIRGKGRIALTTIAAKAYPQNQQAARKHIKKEQARAQRRIHSQARNKVSKIHSGKTAVPA